MTHKYLLDTNALIALRDAARNHPVKDPERLRRMARIEERCKQIPASQLAMSFLSYGELAVWVEKHSQRDKAQQVLAQLLERVVCLGSPTGSAAGSAQDLGQHYGKTRVHLEKTGQKIGGNDLWIAAHALSLGLTVVTNNQGEFTRVPGLQTEDWTA